MTSGQGHKVKGQGHIYAFMKNYCFGYRSWTDWWILMILTYTIDIDEPLKLTQGQGQRSRSHTHLCKKSCFSYNSWTDDWILMVLRHVIDIDETVKLTHGQSQRSRSHPAAKHFWKYENMHLWQTRATDIFTRRKCPCYPIKCENIFDDAKFSLQI